jgi:hypothetical protein
MERRGRKEGRREGKGSCNKPTRIIHTCFTVPFVANTHKEEKYAKLKGKTLPKKHLGCQQKAWEIGNKQHR